MGPHYHSWGRLGKPRQTGVRLTWRHADLPVYPHQQPTFLPFGNGRSYGDSCLNADGVLLDTRGLDRFIAFDASAGILRCEAGVLLRDILALIVPRGWFLPVTPGTQLVTVGGSIANDVHGKNHHRAGTFGCHVRRFELLRSDGLRLICSPTENPDWFGATIGGLGLTGVILWAEMALKRIQHAAIEVQTIAFPDLDRFFELSSASDQDFEYTVAWIDGLARGKHLGRGLFIRANHAKTSGVKQPPAPQQRLSIPLEPPVAMVNRLSVGAFNQLYFHKHRWSHRCRIVHYGRFFYPLDGIGHWNRLYGPHGFLQYQCVVPCADGKDVLRGILQRTAVVGQVPFFAVLKVFGKQPSPGLLSFPRPGVTLALDFPFRGEQTLRLLNQLDQMVMAADGAVYPAKDARMSAKAFQHFFPQWESLETFRDAKCSSRFWQRVTQE